MYQSNLIESLMVIRLRAKEIAFVNIQTMNLFETKQFDFWTKEQNECSLSIKNMLMPPDSRTIKEKK